MRSVSTDMARRQLSQLLEQVYYTNTQIQIKRNKRPMAWLVGAPYLEKLTQIVDGEFDFSLFLAPGDEVLDSDYVLQVTGGLKLISDSRENNILRWRVELILEDRGQVNMKVDTVEGLTLLQSVCYQPVKQSCLN